MLAKMNLNTNDHLGRAIFSIFIEKLFNLAFTFGANIGYTLAKKRKTVMICFGILLMSSLMTFAQVTAGTGEVDLSAQNLDPETVVTKAPAVPSHGLNSIEIAGIIADGIDAKLAGLANSNGLLKIRDAILGVGLAIGLFWTGLKTMVAGKGIGELLGEWIPILITAGVVTAFTTPGPGSAGNQITDLMNTVTTSLTTAAGGAKINTSSVRGVVAGAVDTTFTAIQAVIATPRQSEIKLSVGGILAGIPTAIFALMMKMITSFLIAISMCVYMATAVMAMISLNLVIALAPVMVPFLIFKPTAWLFDSWLRFLLGACMLKLVGAVMLALTSGLMQSMSTLAAKFKADAAAGTAETFTGDILLFSVMLLVAVLAGLLMAQVPTIASGLLAGNAGGAGFSGLKGVSQTMGARAGSAATGAAANLVADKAPKFGREARAMAQGAKDMKEGINTGGREFGGHRAQIAYARGRSRPPSPPKP